MATEQPISEILADLTDRAARLESQMAEMRHDLETTNGLYAFDKQEFGPGDAFQIKHVSLMNRQERYEHFKAAGREMPVQEYRQDVSYKGWIIDPLNGETLAFVKRDGSLVFDW